MCLKRTNPIGNLMKMIIIESFQWLALWKQLKMNGKETPKESFEKFTGHIFLKQPGKSGADLHSYITVQKDRNHSFRQRDALMVLVTDRVMAGEKADYMHYTGLHENLYSNGSLHKNLRVA